MSGFFDQLEDDRSEGVLTLLCELFDAPLVLVSTICLHSARLISQKGRCDFKLDASDQLQVLKFEVCQDRTHNCSTGVLAHQRIPATGLPAS